MHITSKSLKRGAAALVLTLAVASAAFGLTGCGSSGGMKKAAQAEIGQTLQ